MVRFYLNTTTKNGKYIKHKSILLGSSHSPQHKVPWFSIKENIRIKIKRKGFISKTNFGYGKKCKESHCKKRNLNTGDFMKKVPTATCALRDKYIVSIERVYTPSTFFYEIICSLCNKKEQKRIYYMVPLH